MTHSEITAALESRGFCCIRASGTKVKVWSENLRNYAFVESRAYNRLVEIPISEWEHKNDKAFGGFLAEAARAAMDAHESTMNLMPRLMPGKDQGELFDV